MREVERHDVAVSVKRRMCLHAGTREVEVKAQRGAGRVAALLGAPLGAPNHGVNALASGTLAAWFHASEDASVCMVDYGTDLAAGEAKVEGRSVSVQTILLRFSTKPWQPNHILRLLARAALLRLAPFSAARQRALARNAWLASMSHADVHLAISGGDSFSDIYGLERLLYVSLPQMLVILLRKPLVLLPQTYGPFQGRLGRAIARYILRRAALIYSRDQEGLKVVRGLLGREDPRVRFAYDMGFALEPLAPEAAVQERLRGLRARGELIGFNVSGLLAMGGYRRNNMFGLKADYPGLVRGIIEFLIETRRAQVLLVPHVFGDAENSESDVPACRRIMSELGDPYQGRLHYLEGNFDQHEIKYIIGQCDFFLGSRMHACIAALSQCVPAVGLAYSRKFAGVLESVGGGSRVVDLREADEAQVLEAIGQALEKKDMLRSELEERMPKIRESVLNFFARPEFKELLARE